MVIFPKSQIEGLRDRGQYLIRGLRFVWEAAHRWTLAWSCLLIVQGLLPVATVYLTRYLVDSMVAAAGKGAAWENVSPVLGWAGLMAAVLIVTELLGVLSEWIRTAQSELVQDHVTGILHTKAASVDMAFFESSKYFDTLQRARDEASTRPLAVLESVGSFVQSSVTMIAMSAVLLTYGIGLPLVLLISTLPAFYAVLRTNRRMHAWWERTTEDRRRVQYYSMVLTEPSLAGEMRLFNLSNRFQSAFRELRRRLRAERMTLFKQQSLTRLGAEVIALGVMGGTMVWMVYRTVGGGLSLGDVALFYQAFQRGQGLMRTLLGNIGQMYSNSLFLGNLFEFLETVPTVVDPPDPVSAPPMTHSIRFRDVTFRYPGSERVALRGFNLTIPAGQTVAIVGPNGAGKSTLLKLLCRFYDPVEGGVEFDGIDLRRMRVADVRRMITILFQLAVTYQMTARDNILLGNQGNPAAPGEVEACAKASGADTIIDRLPHGYDTVLGRFFTGGTDLSSGEWQRISMARAYLRQAPVIVLDEPTSFMDSWAEAEWFNRLKALANGRTTIVITHRFTIAMRADTIRVMDQGQIVESGTHEELLSSGGLYAQSWAAQMDAAQTTSSPAAPVAD